MPVAEGGEGVRPGIAVSGVAVAVLPPVGTPMVVEGEDGGAPSRGVDGMTVTSSGPSPGAG